MRRWAPSGLASGLAGALLLGAVLSGCSEEGEAYCRLLGTEQRTLSDLAAQADQPGVDVLTPSLESLLRLRTDAPADLRDEWDTVVRAWQALADEVERVGVDPAQYRPGAVPEGLTAADRRSLAAVASKLDTPAVRDAATAIEDHAAQVCDVDFTA